MDEPLYLNEDFHHEIAHLFYALAAADKSIELEEKRKIVTEVECYWHVKTSTFDSKELIFQDMRENILKELDKEAAYDSFAAFYRKNKSDFSTDIKIKLKKTANAIVQSFSGANKSELTMLSQLHFLFQEE